MSQFGRHEVEVPSNEFKVKKESVLPTLRADVNGFLFSHLPDDIRLIEIDKLSTEIHRLVAQKWGE